MGTVAVNMDIMVTGINAKKEIRNLNVRAAVHLLNARMGFVFASSITMGMDITAHLSIHHVKIVILLTRACKGFAYLQ